jgi:hypothetical protein
MRRVIVEQMDALAELNRIVARHGRSIEMPATRSSVRDDALAAVAQANAQRQGPTRNGTSFGSAAAPGASIGRRPESRTQSTSNGEWLSSVLARASREAEPEPVPSYESYPEPPLAGGAFDAISIDIARMVDSDAVTDLWDRRQSGEAAAASYGLYTLQGQQTFEEIRRKYRGDRDFKQTVDHYLVEFERLLDEVGQGEHGRDATRSYLTSETGKVYTMLAHAAGRLD